ncbi:MAG TPA: hydroxyacylglutathione hydrolase [Methylococcaceae bacterium]|nr:hydroxyacylglutathione hydrolase [Methylococcaceae bacterium]
MLHIEILPALADNYIYLLREPKSGETAAVDPADAQVVLDALRQRGWKLTYVLNTHHHADHVDGNRRLKAETGCRIVGAQSDAARIPGLDLGVAEGEILMLGNAEARILDLSGHTRGHIGFWFPEEEAVFCGDTLFSLGCGRLFEGSADEMWRSLGKLAGLPPATRIYCAHEYTEANGRFALTLEPDNPALQQRLSEVRALRARHLPTLPVTVAQELAANPFLRPHSVAIRRTLGMEGEPEVAVFAAIRRRKDQFRG